MFKKRKPSVALMVATDLNHGIGLNNKLPWRIPEDLQMFKKFTMGKTIVMGRKTFESIGFALPGRKTVVITRDATFKAEGCHVHVSPIIDRAFLESLSNGISDVVVVGGSEIYELCAPFVDTMIVTIVQNVFEVDTYFNPPTGNFYSQLVRTIPPSPTCEHTAEVWISVANPIDTDLDLPPAVRETTLRELGE